MIVAPGTVLLIARRSSSCNRIPSKTRCALTVPLHLVRGIVVGGGVIVRWRSWLRSRPSRGTVRAITRVACIGRVVLFTVARRSSSVVAGTDSGRHGRSGTDGVALGASSWMALVISIPDMPSMAAWWILVTTAKQPAGTPCDVVQPFDDVELPQRPVEIERTRDQASHLDAQLSPVARLRQRDVTNVELEVEVGILDPVRVVQVERHPHQPLAEDAGLVQPLVDVVEDPLERDPAARRGRRVVDREAGPRHVRPGRLGVEERSVHSAQLLHEPSPRSSCCRRGHQRRRPQSLPLTATSSTAGHDEQQIPRLPYTLTTLVDHVK